MLRPHDTTPVRGVHLSANKKPQWEGRKAWIDGLFSKWYLCDILSARLDTGPTEE
jgi:hypothetical protein